MRVLCAPKAGSGVQQEVRRGDAQMQAGDRGRSEP